MRLPKLLLLLLLVPLTLSGQQSVQWIVGSWRSNRELTVQTIRLKREISPELRARLDNLFGRMVVTFTEKEMSGFTAAYEKWPDWHYSSPYSVVMATDTKLVLRSLNPQTKQEDASTITFEGPDRYWIPLEKIEGREYFDRIPPEQAKTE